MEAKGKRRRAPLLTAAFVLALCSATGLLAGVVTRQVASAAPARTPVLAQSTSTLTQPLPSATATSAPTNTAPSSNQFAVSVSVSGQAHPGQDIQVNASASAGDAPVAGVKCILGPDTGSDPLLQTWPDASTTDATGKCGWSITLPQQTALGSYRIRVDGSTAQYHAWSFTTVRVS